jgi:cytochrome bd-type quinol oxidase subunit 2
MSESSGLSRDTYGYMVPAVSTGAPIDPNLTASGEKKKDTIEQKTSTFVSSLGLVGIMLILIYIAMVYIAGYHAATEYATDVPHMRWLRILAAVLLAPFYIGYVLLKSFVYDFLKSPANSITYSFLDSLLQTFTQSATDTAKKLGNVAGKTMVARQ